MSICVARAFVTAACLVWLAGCESATKTSELFRSTGTPETTASVPETTPAKPSTPAAPDVSAASASVPETTGTLRAPAPAVVQPVLPPPFVQPPPGGPYPLGPWSAAEDPFDDLSLGKRHYREENYGLAEMHFRRVAEKDNVPAQRKAEAFVGLGAVVRPPEALRTGRPRLRGGHRDPRADAGDPQQPGLLVHAARRLPRARAKLTEALTLDPTNPYIQNNIELLEKSMRGGGGRKKVYSVIVPVAVITRASG